MLLLLWRQHHIWTRHSLLCISFTVLYPSVLWRCCWLGGRKGIWPVKNWVVGCWCGYLSGARCTLAYGPADATATHCLSCFTKIQIGFTFLVPAHPGSPGKRAVKRLCVCVLLTVNWTVASESQLTDSMLSLTSVEYEASEWFILADVSALCSFSALTLLVGWLAASASYR